MIRGDVLRARRQSAIFFLFDLHKSHIPAPKALNATYVAIKSIIGREDDDDDDNDDSYAQWQATNQLRLAFARIYSLRSTPETDGGNPGIGQIFAAYVFAISTTENPACLSPMGFVTLFVTLNRNSHERKNFDWPLGPTVLLKYL